METKNFLLLTDGYKVSHHLQYPPGTEKIFSYFSSRGGKFPSTLFFGLQYVLKRHLVGQVVTQAMIDEAECLFNSTVTGTGDVFNKAGWQYILKEHGGRLPLEIRAVPEGRLVDTGNVLFTVENTDDKVPWLTNYVEALLSQTWYPMTVATNSYHQKLLLRASLERTADSSAMSFLPWMLGDFGCRGVSSMESAGIGGAAHLVNFLASDTLPGVLVARDYYSATVPSCWMGSGNASEHSTMTTWGRHGETEVVRHMLEKAGPAGMVSVVVDSYDMVHMLEEVLGTELKEEVEARSGCLVVRPDSGDPAETAVSVLDILGSKFGFSNNSKGFRVLPPCVRVIQGDGITYESLQAILPAIEASGWSLSNISFGSGGGLLQRLDRDTQRCAYKCSLMVRDGEEVDVYKAPVTDPGKTSKAGRLVLLKGETGGYCTVRREEVAAGQEDVMVTVFRDGELVKDWDWEEVRAGQLLGQGQGQGGQPAFF